MPLRLLAAIACLLLMSAAQLPETGPLPEKKPQGNTSGPDEIVPKPLEKPVDAPTQDPQTDGAGNDGTKDEEKAPEPAPVEKEDVAAYQACIAQLTSLGAVFEEKPAISADSGCGIDKPLSVSRILPDVTLKPEGTMRCETALKLSLWVKNAVGPALQAVDPQAHVTAINQASTYICRNRNSAEDGKISEHARGNAVDIASLSLSKGDAITMVKLDDISTLDAAFQRAVSAAACLYFTTVLSPGSDATHQDHMHLDVLQRKGGYRYCK